MKEKLAQQVSNCQNCKKIFIEYFKYKAKHKYLLYTKS